MANHASRIISATFASAAALSVAGCAGGTFDMQKTSTINPYPTASQAEYGVPVAGPGVVATPYGVRVYDYDRGNHASQPIGTIGLVGSPGVKEVGECYNMSHIYGPPTVDPRNGRLINPQVVARTPRRMPCDGYRYYNKY